MMEDKPPPYTPQAQHFSNVAPSAPPIAQMEPIAMYPNLQSQMQANPQSTDFQGGFNLNPISFDQTNVGVPAVQNVNSNSTPTIPSKAVMAPLPPPVPQRVENKPISPLRCQAGTVQISTGTVEQGEADRIWEEQFIQVREGVLIMSPSREERSRQTTKSLKKLYISQAGKRLIAVEDNVWRLLIKPATEGLARRWFVSLAQYCYIAPMMEGYADKLLRSKKIYEERFLHLTSDGVLSWYDSEEESDLHGAIQLRGERCVLDDACPRTINILIQPKSYKFRFETAREAQLWLAAFQWHHGRKPLEKAQVHIRNKAK